MADRRRVSREVHDAFENDQGLVVPEPKEQAAAEPKAAQAVAAQREVIEHLQPSRMIPDRFQPRPVLPVELHRRFFAGDIDCYQAAREWLKLAEKDEGHGRRVSELTFMADTIDEHGQIKPITGSWISGGGGGYVFQIETGERRFWGSCLRHVAGKQPGEPLLRVETVARPTLERQIVENRHAQPPTAVAQAREIAALVLQQLGQQPSADIADPYDYFRQAIDLPERERLPRGTWQKIGPLMNLGQRRMQQMLSLLRLPTPLLEKADRHNLSARVLEAVLEAPPERWADLLDQAVAEGLSGEEVAEAATQAPTTKPKGRTTAEANPTRSAMRGLRGFANVFDLMNARSRRRILDDLADEVVVSGEAGAVADLIDELSRLVRARLKRGR